MLVRLPLLSSFFLDLQIASYFVHVMTHHSQMHLYLENWVRFCWFLMFMLMDKIERELVRSEDTAVLFRGDSLGIKSFDVFLSWIGSHFCSTTSPFLLFLWFFHHSLFSGKDYLTETLGAHIMRIVSEDKRCELEEIKLEKTDKLRYCLLFCPSSTDVIVGLTLTTFWRRQPRSQSLFFPPTMMPLRNFAIYLVQLSTLYPRLTD